jgi:hypothetical protein
MEPLWTILWLALGVGAAGGALWGLRRLSLYCRDRKYRQARELFHRRREWLEAEFLKLASQSGKPRGLTWVDCDFDDDVQFARDRSTGSLRALVAVAIRFQATPGGGMEHVEAVGNLRAATAVFSFERNRWISDGRAVFNLNPIQTIKHFGREMESVE